MSHSFSYHISQQRAILSGFRHTEGVLIKFPSNVIFVLPVYDLEGWIVLLSSYSLMLVKASSCSHCFSGLADADGKL